MPPRHGGAARAGGSRSWVAQRRPGLPSHVGRKAFFIPAPSGGGAAGAGPGRDRTGTGPAWAGKEGMRLTDREEQRFLALARRYERVPLLRVETNDLETPISLYLKLRPLGASFLLESAEGGQSVGRYSFIGLRPYAWLRSRPGGTEVDRDRKSVV